MTTEALYDVAIIGAGPCGLAVAARLREQTPSALFTDAEHQRFWQRYRSQPTLDKERKRGSFPKGTNVASNPSQYSMIAFDASGSSWAQYWSQKFDDLNIDYCRSPMFFHVDPQDRDSLLRFTQEQSSPRENMQEITGVVGKEISKHRQKKKMQRRRQQTTWRLQIDERDRNDYHAPSSSVFKAHNAHIAQRYGLEDMVKNESIESIDFDPESQIFKIEAKSNCRYFARIVVLAIGAGREPGLPANCPLRDGSLCHCLEFDGCKLPAHVLKKIKERHETNVVVIGGGLTAAQIAHLAVRRRVSRVWMLMRGKYKVKHFDIDLEWVAKVRNQRMSAFHMLETDEERLEMLTNAKGGGSITPRFSKILEQHCSAGRLQIHQNTTLTEGRWDPQTRTWQLGTEPSVALPEIDHVIYATGLPSQFETLPLVQPLFQQYPIPCKGGMPCLTHDLMWTEDVPCLVTGRFAGLRLGPGAANLMGARHGAERVAWKIEQLLGKGEVAEEASQLDHYVRGISNQYSSLSLCNMEDVGI